MRRLAVCLAALVVASAGFATDKNAQESCYLAIPFDNGNTASIQLANKTHEEQTISVERYSSSGNLLDNIKKAVPANGKLEVRIDLSAPVPEFGWIRVLSEGASVDVSAAIETVKGDMLWSVPQKSVSRHPGVSKHRMPQVPHKWSFDVTTNLGFMMYFVNLSDYPVQAAMCQDDVPDCSNPTLPYTVAPMASISFPIDQSRRYGVVESTPGYSVATALRLSDGTKQMFKASSCIKYEGSSVCASQPLSPPGTTTKFITPIQQQVIKNVEDSRASPAAAAAKAIEAPSGPEALADLIKNGGASKCVIATEPPGAEIYLDGLKLGVTPVVFVMLKRGDTPRTLEIRLNGYRTIEKHLVPDGQLISIISSLEKQ